MQAQEVLSEYEGKVYRVGDYLYLYDYPSDSFLMNRWSEEKMNRPSSCTDGPYYPLGGGRNPGESSVECVLREVGEETSYRLTLTPDDLTFVMKLRIIARQSWSYEDGVLMDGKEMNIYLALGDRSSLPRFANTEIDGSVWEYDWYPRQEVLGTNRFFTEDVWRRLSLSYPV